MKVIQKVAITSVQSYTGQIIDSMTTSSDKHTNAPSINAVETEINKCYTKTQVDALLPQTSSTNFTFKNVGQQRTYTGRAYRYGKVVTIYWEIPIQEDDNFIVNVSGVIPANYRPQNPFTVQMNAPSSGINYIALNVATNGNIQGVVQGTGNESGTTNTFNLVSTFIVS